MHLKNEDRSTGWNVYGETPGELVCTFITEQDALEYIDSFALMDRFGSLLNGVVNALKGDPPSNILWSTHDAPEVARSVIAELHYMRKTIALIYGHQRAITATLEALVSDPSVTTRKW